MEVLDEKACSNDGETGITDDSVSTNKNEVASTTKPSSDVPSTNR